MSAAMRCPGCGATNSDRASWCGQCYTTLAPQRQAPAPTAGPAAGPGVTAQQSVSGALRTRGFRRDPDGGLQWACARCGQYSALDDLRCGVCGAGIAERYEPPGPTPTANWGAALALSALLPGAGQLALGRYGTGVARCLLFVVWLLGAAALTAAGAGVAGAPLWLGTVALWAASVLDVLRLRQGQPELLAGRALLWLVVAVTLLLVVAVAVATVG